MKQIVSFIKQINIWKTLLINFKVFTFKDAIKFPILCFNDVKISVLHRGVKCLLKFGAVKIGAVQLGFSECRSPITKLSFVGNVFFKGKASIGNGSYIDCSAGASLTFGNDFRATGLTTILASKEIVFGTKCLVSWDTLIMDTDAHSIYTHEDIMDSINPSKPIQIGDNVWIGARATILKGVTINSNAVIAAICCVTKDVKEGTIAASSNQKEIRNNIRWDGRNPNMLSK